MLICGLRTRKCEDLCWGDLNAGWHLYVDYSTRAGFGKFTGRGDRSANGFAARSTMPARSIDSVRGDPADQPAASVINRRIDRNGPVAKKFNQHRIDHIPSLHVGQCPARSIGSNRICGIPAAARPAAVDQTGCRRGRRPGQFLLTGSTNLLLMKSVSESLAGRASYLTLWPMTRREQRGLGAPASGRRSLTTIRRNGRR